MGCGCKNAEGVCGCSKNAESEYEVVHLKGGHLVAKFIHIDCPMTKEIDGWDVEDGEIQFFDPDDYPTGVCATCGKSVTLSDKDNAWVQTWYEDEEWDAEKNAEEPVVQEPDFIPNGDGRVIGQQDFAINLTPLHAESFNDKNEELMVCNNCKTEKPMRGFGKAVIKYELSPDEMCMDCQMDKKGYADEMMHEYRDGLDDRWHRYNQAETFEADRPLKMLKKENLGLIWDSKKGQLRAIPAYSILEFMVWYVDWNGRWEIAGDRYDTFEEALVEAKEAAKEDGKHSQIILTYYDKPLKERKSDTVNQAETFDTVGSPSPTFNEDITGQDGPSANPTNQEFEAMTRFAPSKNDVETARRKIKAHSSWGEVIYDRYLVNQQGSSNKFYYTAISEKDGRYYPLGAWGRIGYMNTVNIYNALGKKENPSAHLNTMKGAYDVIQDKELSKINARKSEKRYVDSTLTKWDAESLSEIEGPTAEATAGGLHSPSSFDMTWEDGSGQSSASIPPNEIAWAENTGFPTWAKLGAGIAVLYGVGKVITSKMSEQKSADNLKSAIKARKGCCGKSAETKTVRKDSEYSVGQINPVEVEGQSDVHGAEEVQLSKPHQGPQSTHYSNERPSQKMW